MIYRIHLHFFHPRSEFIKIFSDVCMKLEIECMTFQDQIQTKLTYSYSLFLEIPVTGNSFLAYIITI